MHMKEYFKTFTGNNLNIMACDNEKLANNFCKVDVLS
jgi:hypothetical protein